MISDLKILTLNVRGINDKKKRQTVFYWLRKQDADIIALQETHLGRTNDEWKWSREWDGQSYWTVAAGNSKGVALLFNRKQKFEIKNVVKEQTGRLISLSVKIADKMIRLVCIYSPNNDNERVKYFKSKIENHMDPEKYNILLGDFNCTLKDEDRSGNLNRKEVGREELISLMKRQQLYDVFCKRHPDSVEYTYFKPNSSVRSRIDFILPSEIMDRWVQEVGTIPAVFSDHNVVYIRLRINEETKGQGRWKMSKKVIESELFRETFTHFWNEWTQSKDMYENNLIWWAETKDKIKEVTTWCASIIRKKEKGDTKRLEDTLLSENNKLHPNQEIIESCKAQLNELYAIKTDGARIRASIKWFEKGETSSAYFHNLEKHKVCQKMWSSIKNKDGDVLEGIDMILERQREFYTELYKETEIDREAVDDMLRNVTDTLDESEVNACDANIQYDEVEQVVKGLRGECSPGIDGIINEFYKMYWSLIGKDLLEVFGEIEQKGELVPGQNLGVITLLYKAGDRNELSNWRPITVLNTDYKIIEKVLSNRLKPVLGRIIQSDQKAYLKGRQIGENVRLNEDIITYCENYDKPGAILYIDQSKAFDRVNWEWLDLVLVQYGFGETFRKWVRILYTNARSTIFTNGFLSECIQIERGVRQGSPLGPYLYILQSEPLAETIRKDQEIEGVKVTDASGESSEIKLAIFADDTQGYVSTLSSIERWFKHLGQYSKASGAIVNKDKTKGTLLGPMKHILGRPNFVNWTEGPITVLGVNQGVNKDEVEFWRKKIAKMKKKLTVWKMRNLTLYGKAYLVNSVGLSTLLYAAELQSVPDNVIREVNTIIWDFIWDGKPDKVKRVICMRKVSEGGINAPNVSQIIKACRLKILGKVLEEGEERWKILPRFFLGIGGNNSLLVNKGENMKMPIFYKECLHTWYDVKCEKKPKVKTVVDMLNQNANNERYTDLEVKQGDDWRKLVTMSRAEVQAMLAGPLIKSSKEMRWEDKFEDVDWKSVYKILTIKTIPRKVRIFHWKMLNSAVYTEQRLKQFHLSDGMCSLCGGEEENCLHLVADCDAVKEFWKSLISLIRKSVPSFKYNEEFVLLGCTQSNSGNLSEAEVEMVNFLILNAKWVIWKRRCVTKYDGKMITQEMMWNWFKSDVMHLRVYLF